MSRRYDPRENAYIGKNPIKWYELTIWGMTANVKSDSAGAARYAAWLNFHDAYDIPFGEFCKQSKIRRAGVHNEKGGEEDDIVRIASDFGRTY